MAELKIFKDPEQVAERFAEFFYELVQNYQIKGNLLHIALSGGSTPKLWFDILRREYAHKIPWHITHFYWGDERMVSADNAESNYGEAKRILFDYIDVPEENIHPVLGENTIGEEITRYENLILDNLEMSGNIPVFDLIVLGMGDDGHTASIFPHQMNLMESDKICAKAKHPVTGQVRMTLTGKVINHAKNIVFLITGENKANMFGTVFLKKNEYNKLPASHIHPKSGRLQYFIDQAAARKIELS